MQFLFLLQNYVALPTKLPLPHQNKNFWIPQCVEGSHCLFNKSTIRHFFLQIYKIKKYKNIKNKKKTLESFLTLGFLGKNTLTIYLLQLTFPKENKIYI